MCRSQDGWRDDEVRKTGKDNGHTDEYAKALQRYEFGAQVETASSDKQETGGDHGPTTVVECIGDGGIGIIATMKFMLEVV